MIDGLVKNGLKKFGITPETANAVLGVAAVELRNVAGDMLGATIEAQVTKTLRPMLADMRAQLLAGIAGDPPPSFATRIRVRYGGITDEQVSQLWADVIASIAEQPAKAPATETAA